jgi:hypothetical protein
MPLIGPGSRVGTAAMLRAEQVANEGASDQGPSATKWIVAWVIAGLLLLGGLFAWAALIAR